jgi:hypothetical protein
MTYPVTPGRPIFYGVRSAVALLEPNLPPDRRAELTGHLMTARRDKGRAIRADDAEGKEAARQRVDAAKQALGERGPLLWTDGAPDWNRHLAENTPYADWFAGFNE